MKDKCISCARNVNGSVPLAVHENLRAQSNVDKRRLWIVVIILIVLVQLTQWLGDLLTARVDHR